MKKLPKKFKKLIPYGYKYDSHILKKGDSEAILEIRCAKIPPPIKYIKIVSATDLNTWYSNKIGSIYAVVDTGLHLYRPCVFTGRDYTMAVDEGDYVPASKEEVYQQFINLQHGR